MPAANASGYLIRVCFKQVEGNIPKVELEPILAFYNQPSGRFQPK